MNTEYIKKEVLKELKNYKGLKAVESAISKTQKAKDMEIEKELDALCGDDELFDTEESLIKIEAMSGFAHGLKGFIFNHFHQLGEKQKKKAVIDFEFFVGQTAQVAVLMYVLDRFKDKEKIFAFRKKYEKEINEGRDILFEKWLEDLVDLDKDSEYSKRYYKAMKDKIVKKEFGC